ncbi:MAG TPA: sulfite exporter TauE/SafE family protein [Anaerolineales bacterium]|nr:sulfite exporter TauE/SafE family protein [Anaerolineales bacterium]
MPASKVRVGTITTQPDSNQLRGMRYWTWGLAVFVLVWLLVFISVFPNPVGLVQTNWPLFFVGFLGAILGNATAVGGGVVFIPVMILIYQLPAVTALKLALASQSFGMTSGALGWARRGIVQPKVLKVAIPALLVGSTISSLVIHPNALLVKGLFGPASIFIGLVTLYFLDRHGNREEIPAGAYPWLAVMALIGGTLTGWVAIGEGEVVAAFLMLVYGLRAERGIGLGVILLSVNSIYLTMLHQFFLGGIPWEMALFTGFGCVFGGRLGPYLSQWIGPRKLKLGFATIAIIDGGIFLLQFILQGAS